MAMEIHWGLLYYQLTKKMSGLINRLANFIVC